MISSFESISTSLTPISVLFKRFDISPAVALWVSVSSFCVLSILTGGIWTIPIPPETEDLTASFAVPFKEPWNVVAYEALVVVVLACKVFPKYIFLAYEIIFSPPKVPDAPTTDMFVAPKFIFGVVILISFSADVSIASP